MKGGVEAMPRDRSAREERRGWEGHRGQALAWVAVMLPFFLAIVGLAIDGGIVFGARREAQNIADAAARAGAMEVNLARYRATAGTWVELEPPAAAAAAAGYLAAQGWPDATVDASVQSVTVTASKNVPLGFLKLVGVNRVRISATARAAPYSGITAGQP